MHKTNRILDIIGFKLTDLLGHRALGLDARSDLAWELWLGAVALEVGQLGASISGESIEEAWELAYVSK